MYKLFLTLIVLLFLTNSCRTDFDLNAEWQDITVVYGILNQNDSIHYIRIQKGFLGEGNVMHMALEPDSNLYPGKLNVRLEEWFTGQSNYSRIIEFDTVSIHDKEPGIFFSPKQPLYYSLATLNTDAIYKLRITNTLTEKEISAETNLVGNFGITSPPIPPRPPYPALNFYTPNSPSNSTIFGWRPAKNGGRYQMILRFNYLEVNTQTNDTVLKHLDWNSPVIKSVNPNSTSDIEVRFMHETFFNMVETRIPILQNVVRFPLNFQTFYYVAATELSTFLEVHEPSSSLVQEKPEYSNIENGIGIFSARYDRVIQRPVHIFTVDRLVEMEAYNFRRLSE